MIIPRKWKVAYCNSQSLAFVVLLQGSVMLNTNAHKAVGLSDTYNLTRI
jgi:hypothetical protein